MLGLLGALCVLVAFAGRNKIGQLEYLVLNLGGAFLLATVALTPFQPGFFILNVVWALVALKGLWKLTSK